MPIKELSFRKFNEVDEKVLIRDMNLDQINGDTLQEILDNFNKNVMLAVDKQIMIKKLKVAVRDMKPWYNSTLHTSLG